MKVAGLKIDMVYIAKQIGAWGVIWAAVISLLAAGGWMPMLLSSHEQRVVRENRLLCKDITFKLYRAEESERGFNRESIPAPADLIRDLSDLKQDVKDFNC